MLTQLGPGWGCPPEQVQMASPRRLGFLTRGGWIPRDRARQESYCFYDLALKGMPCHFHRQDVLVKVVPEPARFKERELKFLSMEKCQVML